MDQTSSNKNPHRFIASFINSSYSFWWDVVKDWDMSLFSQSRSDSSHPYGVRFNRCFHSDRLYHFVIIADLALRFSWLWRIIPGFSWLPETEFGLFVLMFLEVARRWMWVFFRVEAEHCKIHSPMCPPLAPLLGSLPRTATDI